MAASTSVTIRREPSGKVILDEPLIGVICDAVRAGASIEVAAERIGVHRNTVGKWLRRGNAALDLDPTIVDQPEHEEWGYAKLAAERPRAEATAEVSMVTLIVQAAQGGKVIEDRQIVHPNGDVERIKRYSAPDWRAAAFVLEHRWALRWGRQMRVDMRHSFEPETGREEGERLNNALAAFMASPAAIGAATGEDIEDAEIIE